MLLNEKVYPTTLRLPPLNALRAFEAAARLSTLAAAAAELHVTPSAVSHQIRTLEEALDVRLFRRANRRLTLTKDGRALLPGLSDGFRRLTAAIAELETNQREGVLTVSMLSTMAMRWFMPRLPRFQAEHPEIEVRISTTTRAVDLEREDIDMALRHGQGDWPGLKADFLFQVETIPVCSPELPRPDAPLNSPRNLIRHVLLHADTRSEDWRSWLGEAGESGLRPSRELTFDTTDFALAAAIRGLGVAIADRHIVRDDIESGRLIAPFEASMRHDSGYYLVYPEDREGQPKSIAFRQWLLREVAEM
jgi:LysR family glycine cleavage system transcriptional activator